MLAGKDQTLRERMGGNIRLCVSGSAPLASKIAYFFEMTGLTILEGYGLTETSAGTTVNRPEKNKIGTVGAPFPGSELKIIPSAAHLSSIEQSKIFNDAMVGFLDRASERA